MIPWWVAALAAALVNALLVWAVLADEEVILKQDPRLPRSDNYKVVKGDPRLVQRPVPTTPGAINAPPVIQRKPEPRSGR